MHSNLACIHADSHRRWGLEWAAAKRHLGVGSGLRRTMSLGTGPLPRAGVITIKKRDANADFAKSQTHYAAATRQLNSVFANMDLQLGNSPAVPILDVTFTDTVAMRVSRQAHLPPFLVSIAAAKFYPNHVALLVYAPVCARRKKARLRAV